MNSPWHFPAVNGVTPLITPVEAGWTYCGLRIVELAAGESTSFHTAAEEFSILPISGGATVEIEAQRYTLHGRDSVFARVSDWAYAPIDAEVRLIASTGPAVLALSSARATRRFEPHYGAAEDVPVELRGAGQATRQLNNYMAPGVFDGADKLNCVEVITPDGNWSSYPPHRHDGIGDCLVNNEEIYYFRIGRTGSTAYSAEGFGMHRTYSVDGSIDVNVPVADGDVFVVPHGYHGPCVAAPGYPMYYLNVLAGPGAERTMAFCDDPNHHWIRGSWADQPLDPRLPMTTANGARLA